MSNTVNKNTINKKSIFKNTTSPFKQSFLILTVLILTFSLLLSSCSVEDDTKSQNIEDIPDKKSKFGKDKNDKTPQISIPEFSLTEKDIYGDSATDLEIDISLAIENNYNLNAMLGFPDSGNTMKIHSVCYDNSLNQGYALGIMSNTVAIFQDTNVVKYLNLDLPLSNDLKYAACDNGIMIAATDSSLHKIDGESQEIVGELKFENTLFPNSFSYLPETNLIIIPDLTDQILLFFDGDSFTQSFELKLSPETRTSTFENDAGELIMLQIPKLSDEQTIQIYDPKTFEIKSESSVQISNQIEDLAFDPILNEFWALNQNQITVYNIDSAKTSTIDLTISEPNKILYGAEKIIILTENGFDEEGEAGFNGGAQIIDANTKETTHTLELPWRHNTVDIDEDNSIAYITNNDGNSIRMVDLNTGFSDETNLIDVGTACEDGIVTNDGTIFIRNRLGGSTIIQLDPNTETLLESTTNGNWPVGIVYDSELDNAYSYNFLDGTIEVFKSNQKNSLETYSIDGTMGNSDAIGDMIYDSTRKHLYIITPELNSITIVDATTGEILAKPTLTDYLSNYLTLGGPGTLLAELYEPTGKLITYTPEDTTLRIYDGLEDFNLLTENYLGQKNLGLKTYPYSIYVDNYQEKFYLGEYIFDAKTFEQIGTLSHGVNVVTIDNENGFMVTSGKDAQKNEVLYVTDLEENLIDEIIFAEERSLNARFTYDQNNFKIYAFYLIEGELIQISLV